MARRLIAPAIVLLLLAAPAAASAATFYAREGGGSTVGCPSIAPCDLPNAISQAEGFPGHDAVQVVGRLRFTPTTPLTLTSADGTDLLGSGRTDQGTVIDGPSSPALDLGPHSSAANLIVRSPGTVVHARNGAALSGVTAETSARSGTVIGLDSGGAGDTLLRQVKVTAPAGSPVIGIAAAGAPGAATRIDDSVIVTSIGVDLAGGTGVVRRTIVDGSSTGLRAAGATLSASSDVIHAASAAASGVQVFGGQADLRQLTILGGGSSGTGVGASGGAGGGASVRVTGSIVRDFAVALAPAAPGQITVALSDFERAKATGFVDAGGNVDLRPRFVDFAHGNYRLSAASPLIDVAGTDPPTGEESPTDRGNRPRVADGNGDGIAARDMGAYERPGVSAQGVAILAATLTNRRFAVAPSGFAGGAALAPRGTVIVAGLSVPARLQVRVQARRKGRRVGRKCLHAIRRLRNRPLCVRWDSLGSFSRAVAAGGNRIPFSGRVRGRSLPPGRYRLLLRARDGSGARSHTRALGFTIVLR